VHAYVFVRPLYGVKGRQGEIRKSCIDSRLPNLTMSQYAFDRISKDDFEQTLAQYPETVPSKLADMEEQRLSTIPAKLKERKAKGNAYLIKSEVVTLVDWKL
jgi:hypothetical protein